MTKEAERHLTNAQEYLAQGDQYYRKARPEILAAQGKGANTSEIARFLARSRTWVMDVLAWDGKGTLYGKDTERRQTDQAKQVLRESTPEQVAEIVASLPAEAVAKVSKAVSTHYQERGDEAKKEAAKKLREDLGDHVADGLLEEQRLRDAESKYFDARRSVRDGMVLLNACDLDAIPDSWREDFLKTIDDLAQRLEITKSLLTGTLDEDIEAFLAEAGQ